MKYVDIGPNYKKWYKDIPKFKQPQIYRTAEVPSTYDTSEIGKKTGALSKEDLTEYMDEPEVILQKAKIVAQILKDSKYSCVYTGAGISTSSEIPDYRGPEGVWTLGSMGKDYVECKPLTLALPTTCHQAIVKLNEDGIVKSTISTNTDGLHRRSGIPKSSLCELHGNIYLEKCEDCGSDYFRTFSVLSNWGERHITGRKCEKEKCGGRLKDSIIGFGESLPKDELDNAIENSKKADVALVMGTSMRVSPACNLPEYMWEDENKAPGKLIIVNLQKTPYDSFCFVRVFAKTDYFMSLVMKEIYGENFELENFTLERNEKIFKMNVENSNKKEIEGHKEERDFGSFKVVIGENEQGKTEWNLWGGRKNSEVLLGTMIQFKIDSHGKVSGGNVQSDLSSSVVRKDYDGSYDKETRKIFITVTYSFGQIATYSGILREDGKETRLYFEIIKGSEEEGNAIKGDNGYVSGITKYC